MEIKEKIVAMYEKHPTAFNVLGVVTLVLLTAFIIFLAFRFAIPCGKFDNEGLVIAFIGVLATYIVIGNFAQTSRIEEALNKKIRDLDKRTQKCENDNETFTGLSTIVDTLTTKIDSLEHNLQEAKKPLDKKDLGRVLKLFIGREGDVRKYMHLYAKLLNPDAKYLIENSDGTKEQITITYSTEQQLLNFIDQYQCLVDSEEIAYISGVPFNEVDLIYAYQLLNEIETQEAEMQETEKTKEDKSEINKEDQVYNKK